MHADRDCNLRWVAAKGSVRDNLVSHSAQQKNCSDNSVTVSWQQVSIQHFPLPVQCLGDIPGVQQKKKVSNNVHWQNKKNQINFFVCLLYPAKQYSCHANREGKSMSLISLEHILIHQLYLITETKRYTCIVLDFFSYVCVLLFLMKNLATSSWHRAQKKPYLRSRHHYDSIDVKRRCSWPTKQSPSCSQHNVNGDIFKWENMGMTSLPV